MAGLEPKRKKAKERTVEIKEDLRGRGVEVFCIQEENAPLWIDILKTPIAMDRGERFPRGI
ncbi:hypothetical protein ABB02_00199 [Clostridiaceae bacterium JG1575]|nr:hypothetical protein ABB02_00199 [Clostridiaceae bacterium JG1575]